MSGEVIDTNVLVVATAAEQGWKQPRVPTNDQEVIQRVFEWVETFRKNKDRHLVMDFPKRTILKEYKDNLRHEHFGRRVVQHNFDTGRMKIVDLTYWSNGDELVADLPKHCVDNFHDLGDRKMVAAAAAANAPIVNATDSDWTETAVISGLDKLGVSIKQLLTEAERRACKERP